MGKKSTKKKNYEQLKFQSQAEKGEDVDDMELEEAEKTLKIIR